MVPISSKNYTQNIQWKGFGSIKIWTWGCSVRSPSATSVLRRPNPVRQYVGNVETNVLSFLSYFSLVLQAILQIIAVFTDPWSFSRLAPKLSILLEGDGGRICGDIEPELREKIAPLS